MKLAALTFLVLGFAAQALAIPTGTLRLYCTDGLSRSPLSMDLNFAMSSSKITDPVVDQGTTRVDVCDISSPRSTLEGGRNSYMRLVAHGTGKIYAAKTCGAATPVEEFTRVELTFVDLDIPAYRVDLVMNGTDAMLTSSLGEKFACAVRRF